MAVQSAGCSLSSSLMRSSVPQANDGGADSETWGAGWKGPAQAAAGAGCQIEQKRRM